MTRNDWIQKWLTYGLGLLPIWLLDAYILPRYPVFGVLPMLLPLTVASVAVLEGSYAGAGFGLAVGLLWEATYPAGNGGFVFGMALGGMLSGSLSQYALSRSFLGCLFCSSGLLAALSGLRVCFALLNDDASLRALLAVALPELIFSLVWLPLVWLIFNVVYRRVGGDKLA